MLQNKYKNNYKIIIIINNTIYINKIKIGFLFNEKNY